MEIKLGVIGLNSTHFDAFYKLLKNDSRINFTYIFDKDIELVNKRVNEYKDLNSLNKTENALDCDAFMILNRFADEHIDSFKMIEKLKKPVFIDKPSFQDANLAKEFYNIALNKGFNIASYSPLEFSREFKDLKKKWIQEDIDFVNFSGPRECNDIGEDPRFKDPIFYGIHITEMVSNLINQEISDLEYKISHSEFKSNLSIKTKNQKEVHIDLFSKCDEFYNFQYNLNNQFHEVNISLDGSYYSAFIDELYKSFVNKTFSINFSKSIMALELISLLRK